MLPADEMVLNELDRALVCQLAVRFFLFNRLNTCATSSIRRPALIEIDLPMRVSRLYNSLVSICAAGIGASPVVARYAFTSASACAFWPRLNTFLVVPGT